MTPDRTELEWIYQPLTFFEAPYDHTDANFALVIDGGKAVASLTVPADPVAPDVEKEIGAVLEGVFRIRQLQLHGNYKLEGPRIYQHSAGRKNVAIRLEGGSLVLTGGQVDFVVQDAAGNIVRDSKAERVAQHNAVLSQLVPKVHMSTTLRSVLTSFSRSIADPDDELVHLYEVRDALSRHYGGAQAARENLAIDKREWQRLGILANVEPLEQSRHRGKHPQGRRQATDAELEEARDLVRKWIIAFGQTL